MLSKREELLVSALTTLVKAKDPKDLVNIMYTSGAGTGMKYSVSYKFFVEHGDNLEALLNRCYSKCLSENTHRSDVLHSAFEKSENITRFIKKK